MKDMIEYIINRIKSFGSHVKELIRELSSPTKPEASFDNIARAAGIGPAELDELNATIGGVNWNFDEDKKAVPKRRKSIKPEQVQLEQVQVVQGIQPIVKDIERD